MSGENGGKLEAKRFASARGHDNHRVLACEYRLYDFGLPLTEVGEAEMLLKRLAHCIEIDHPNALKHCADRKGC
jgi:hypothetical protein